MKPIARILAIGGGVIVLLLVVFVLLIDGIIENQIEKHGTKAVGARVDLAAADLSFFPLGLTLSGLDVTDPSAPMTNAVSVREISFAMEVMPLLKKEVIVEQMAMRGIRLNTPRQVSGAVPGAAPPAKTAGSKCKGMTMPPLAMPDVKKILNTENLASNQYVQDLNARIAAEKARMQQMLDGLPSQKTFDQYRQRLEKFKGGGGAGGFGALLQAPAELQNIQKDIEKDIQRLRNAQQEVAKDVDRLQADIQQTAQKITADVDRLAGKYGLSSDGLKHMSQALFGDAYCGWVSKAVEWYGRYRDRDKGSGAGGDAAPSAPAGDGVFVWVKTTAASLELDGGAVDGTISNMSNQPARVGAPMKVDFNGRNVAGASRIALNGLLDLARTGAAKMNLAGEVNGFKLTDFKIPGTGDLPVVVSNALADIDFTTEMRGDAVQALAKASLADVVMATGAPGDGDLLAAALSDALASVTRFSATADASGTLTDYVVSVSSDMDKQLQSALTNVVAKQTANLKQQLRQSITADVSGQTDQANAQLAGFGGIQDEITKRLEMGGGLLQKGGKLPF